MALDITNFPWASFALVENRNKYIGDTIGLKRKTRGKGVHRYEFELATIDMALSQGRNIKAQLSRAADDNAVLNYIHPRLGYSAGQTNGRIIQVAVIGTIGDKSVSIKGDGVWSLLAGDYFTFSSDTKVYECAEDTLLNSSNKTVQLTHPLRASLIVNEVVTTNGVKWSMLSDGLIEVEMEASEDQDMSIVLNVVEDI